MFEIIACSPQAAKRIDPEIERGTERDPPNLHHRAKYPFERLLIGEGFAIPIADASETSLRVTSSRMTKKLNRKFTVIRHDDYQCFEVARIA